MDSGSYRCSSDLESYYELKLSDQEYFNAPQESRSKKQDKLLLFSH